MFNKIFVYCITFNNHKINQNHSTMASTSETGHAKNLANLETLTVDLSTFGTAYNPSKAAIKIPALQAFAVTCRTSITGVNTAIAAYGNAVAARELAYAPVSKLTTRIINALKATDVSDQVIDNAKTFARKIQGTRASAKTKANPDADPNAAIEAIPAEPRQISTSQMSYDSRLDSLEKLIKVLASNPLYAPNENDLKVATLTTLYNDLRTKNTAVVTAAAQLAAARIARNELFYNPSTGIVALAAEVKSYVKSLFGASSPQYRQISVLQFKAY